MSVQNWRIILTGGRCASFAALSIMWLRVVLYLQITIVGFDIMHAWLSSLFCAYCIPLCVSVCNVQFIMTAWA